jgi:hypothetical protein
MPTKKIGPETLKKAIIEEALRVKRKAEIYQEALKLNSELAKLNENMGMIASFGFKTPNDASNHTKNGFVNDKNLAHITDLAKEMAEEPSLQEDVLNEVDKLKEEIAKLKQENEELKNKK